MRIPLTLLIIVFVICPGADIYIYKALGRARAHRCLWRGLHAAFAIAAYILLAVALTMPRRGGGEENLTAIMWMLFTFISMYAPKMLFVVLDSISLLPELFHRRRWRPVSWVAAIAALAVFAGMWYGALVNRFQTRVRYVEVDIKNLPDAFDGYRIAQISDLHTGTYGNDTAFVAKLTDRTNALGADVVVFTGDIVNRRSDEIAPHVATLSRMKATDGVFSILGNHDYGDYYDWPSEAAKTANMEVLYEAYRQMGWRLLRNETVFLHRGADSLALIGVENIGDPPFPVYGSLDRAYPAGADGVTKILLSHNPAHWHNDLAQGRTTNDVDLTLAGHTHAMQIEVMGLSPAVFRYPEWGGLYDDGDNRFLYVNIGAGTVGLPMRLGATPEITLITLRKRG